MPESNPLNFPTLVVIILLLALVVAGLVKWLGN